MGLLPPGSPPDSGVHQVVATPVRRTKSVSPKQSVFARTMIANAAAGTRTKRLRKKSAQQEIDLEILRKSAAYFAKETIR